MKDKKGQDNNTHYMPIFMCIGLSIGTAIGASFNNIPTFMSIGLCVGLGIGSLIDAKNRKTSEEAPTTDEEETE